MIALDLETYDWFDSPRIAHLARPVQLAAMRLALVTTYDADRGEWLQWWPITPMLHRVVDLASNETRHDMGLADLWALLRSETLLGWNIDEFDVPLLMLQVARLDPDDAPWSTPIRTIDLMQCCKAASAAFGRERWYTLDAIARATLGRGKDGDGKAAAEDLASGDAERVACAAAYCREDVQLVRDLFAAAQDGGLLLPARTERGEHGDLRLWLNARGIMVDCQRLPTTQDD